MWSGLSPRGGGRLRGGGLDTPGAEYTEIFIFLCLGRFEKSTVIDPLYLESAGESAGSVNWYVFLVPSGIAGDIIAPSPSQQASSLNRPSHIKTPWSMISSAMQGILCTSVSPTYFKGIGELLIVICTSFDMYQMLCTLLHNTPRPVIVRKKANPHARPPAVYCAISRPPSFSLPVSTFPTARVRCSSRNRRRCVRSWAALT